jgi:hypothetical protein
MISLVVMLITSLVTTKRLIFLALAVLVLVAWFSLPCLLDALALSQSPYGNSLVQANSEIIDHLETDFASWYWLPLMLGFALCFIYVAWGGAALDKAVQARAVQDKVTQGGEANTWGKLRKRGGKLRCRLQRQDPPKFYTELIAPRRAIWFVFAAVVLSTIYLSTSVLIELQQRIGGQQPLWRELTATFYKLELSNRLIHLVDSPEQRISQRQAISRDEWDKISDDIYAIGILARDASRLSQLLSRSLNAASTSAQRSEGKESTGTSDQADLKRWLSEVSTVSSTIGRAASELQGEIQVQQGKRVRSGSDYAPNDRQVKSYLILTHALATFRNLDAYVSVRITGPLVTVGILYAVFVLFPWLIYISYLLSKRSTIARETRRDLEDFGLLGRFLDPTEPTGDPAHTAAKGVAAHLAEANAQYSNFPEGSKTLLKRAWELATQVGEGAQYQVLSDLVTRHTCGSRAKDSQPRAQEITLAYNEAVEVVIKMRQFYNREYVVGLLLHTIVSGVGWYYIFFSGSAIRLSEFITVDGASANGLNTYVANNISAVTAAFIGAWVFGALLLLHNWTNDDLNPRSFFYTATRLIIGMLIGFVLANVAPKVPNVEPNLLAFTIGIFPFTFMATVVQECLRLFSLQFIYRDSVQGDGPERRLAWNTRHPLSELDDITTWTESRLDQEGIDSVHSLALANVEQLLLNTPYDGQVLADWIDQAILWVHVPYGKLTQVRASGIRTATDLIATYGHSTGVASLKQGEAAGGKPNASDSGDESQLKEGAAISDEEMARILKSIELEPNLTYVRHFWKRRNRRVEHEMMEPATAAPQLLQTQLGLLPPEGT